MLSCSLCLVKSSQSSIMSLIQPPALLNRQVRLANFSEDSLQCRLGSLEDAGVTNIKLVASILECLTSRDGLSHADLTEASVVPAAELILFIPFTFSMSYHDNFECLPHPDSFLQH